MVWEIFNIYILVEAFWIILPAYAANGLIPLFKGKRRLDFGKNFTDGKPLLGKGKTIEGLVFGTIIGAIIGTIEMFAFPYLPWELSEVTLNIIAMSPLLGAVLGFGAIVGDVVASFFKRRIGLKSGQPAPLMDQLDFLFGAFLFASIMITLKLEWVIIMAVITPGIHLLACFIGYLLKVKKDPW